MSAFVTGAIIGAVGGLFGVLAITGYKEQKFKKILKSITDANVEYAGNYHYASYQRYKKATKFFDSIGILYVIGRMVYYKTKPDEQPISFDMNVCSVQAEPDWRWLKWFSIITPAGEKFYFNSQKMGMWKSNSDETLKGLAFIKKKTAS